MNTTLSKCKNGVSSGLHIRYVDKCTNSSWTSRLSASINKTITTVVNTIYVRTRTNLVGLRGSRAQLSQTGSWSSSMVSEQTSFKYASTSKFSSQLSWLGEHANWLVIWFGMLVRILEFVFKKHGLSTRKSPTYLTKKNLFELNHLDTTFYSQILIF